MGKLDTLRSLREGTSGKKEVKKQEPVTEKVLKQPQIGAKKLSPSKVPAKKTEPPKKRGPKPRSGEVRTTHSLTIPDSIWNPFVEKHRGKVSIKIEEWIKKDLGIK